MRREGDVDDAAVDDRPRLEPGTRVAGWYVVIERVGYGGMADVYSAQHQHLPRKAAIKVLNRANADDAELGEALLDEGRRLVAIDYHPGLVQVQDATIDPATGMQVLIMELLDGVDLREHLRLRKRALGIIEGTTLLLHLATSLGHLHKHKITHGDLKPENVFVQRPSSDGRTRLRLIDFAPSVVGASGKRRRVMGSPLYVSPEPARHAPLPPRDGGSLEGNIIADRRPLERVGILPGSALRVVRWTAVRMKRGTQKAG